MTACFNPSHSRGYFPILPARFRIVPAKLKELAINSTRPVTFLSLALTLSFTLAGCAGITTITPDGQETTRSRDEFERYVESVFRRQNRASLEAGQILIEEISPEYSTALERAELHMLNACSALNQVVRRKIDRNDPGILLEIEVKDTIGDCDFATRMLEGLIAEQK